MGCDIHLYVERRVHGAWQTADRWTDDKYAPGSRNVEYEDQFYTGRNYGLFSILAGVRNRHEIVSISEPRGLPDDMSAELAAYAADACDHTPSHFTLAELLAFDWSQSATYSGVVDSTGWAYVRDHPGKGPREYSASVGGGRVTHHTNAEMEAAWQFLRKERGYPDNRHASAHLRPIGGGNPDLGRFNQIIGSESPHIEVEWVEPYWRAAGGDFGSLILRLAALGAPEDVRIVFWFDN